MILVLRLLLSRKYVKHLRQCFIGYPNILNFVKNTPLRVVFTTLFSFFGYKNNNNNNIIIIIIMMMTMMMMIIIITEVTMNN